MAGNRLKRTLGLTSAISELLAKADFESLAVVKRDTELRIRGLGLPFRS